MGFTLQGVLLEPMGTPLGAPALVSFPASIRRAPMGSGRTWATSGLRSRRELVLPPDPRRDPARRCLPGFLPSRAFSPPVLAFRFRSRGLPSYAFDGVTSKSAGVPGSLGTEGSAGPSRDCRLSSGSPPCDRRDAAAFGAEGGLISSPHGTGALQAARTDLCPLAIEPAGTFVPTRRRRPSVNGWLPLPIVRACFSKNEEQRATRDPIRGWFSQRARALCKRLTGQRVRRCPAPRAALPPQIARARNRHPSP